MGSIQECCVEYYQSHKTLLWIWIMLWYNFIFSTFLDNHVQNELIKYQFILTCVVWMSWTLWCYWKFQAQPRSLSVVGFKCKHCILIINVWYEWMKSDSFPWHETVYKPFFFRTLNSSIRVQLRRGNYLMCQFWNLHPSSRRKEIVAFLLTNNILRCAWSRNITQHFVLVQWAPWNITIGCS